MKEESKKTKEVQIHVKSLKSGAKRHFEALETATIQEIWDQSYLALNETKLPEDIFRAEDGTDLMTMLVLTLGELDEKRIAINHHYEIKGPSGGANA